MSINYLDNELSLSNDVNIDDTGNSDDVDINDTGNSVDTVNSEEQIDGQIHENGDSEEENEDFSSESSETDDKSDTNDENDSNRECLYLALDWAELESSMENNSHDLQSYLNLKTGDVIRVFDGSQNAKLRIRQAQTDPNQLFIDPVSSRDQYHWMEEFLETVEETTLKEKLGIAIDGKGAFRRFKDVLIGYSNERESWFTKRQKKLRAYLMTWLEKKNIKHTNTPYWENGEDEKPQFRGYQISRSRPEPTDLRQAAHETLDMLSNNDLPTASAFLEFLRQNSGHYKKYFK